MLKNVKHVRDKEELLKCSKWVLECISKFNKLVINVMDKDKLLEKVENVKNVLVKRFLRKKKLWMFLLIKVLPTIFLSNFLEREMKFLMP